MPASRPKAPPTIQNVHLPQIGDPEVARAFGDLAERIRLLEASPRPVTSDGRRGFSLGRDAFADLYYRSENGGVTRLGIGGEGDLLTVQSGVPVWEPAASAGLPADWGTVP